MIDIKRIIGELDKVQKQLALRGFDEKKIKKVHDLDTARRNLLQKVEMLKATKNAFSKSIQTFDKAKREVKLKELKKLDIQEDKLKVDLIQTINEFTQIMDTIPNFPYEKVPQGKDGKANKVIKTKGRKTTFDFKAVDYMELAEIHDLIDTERAAKVSGSRFGYLKKDGALLWNALVQYCLSVILKKGFIPFYSPSLVKEEVMNNSGYDTYTDGQDAYYIEKDKLFLVGTGEHALLPYHSNEILDEKQLPLRYTTYSSCYRREAGSYGKDTKGILRVHQFDKQEMLIITTPDKSWEAFDELLEIQEEIVTALGVPYQLLEVCTGDLPKPSARVTDLECWIPSEKKYRETHSASNCTDYQARRNKIRYKTKSGSNYFVHILNATVVTPRLLIAILENFQQEDGSITIPKVLQTYMGNKSVITSTKDEK